MARYLMGMYSDFHMRKVLIATILSSELSCVNINSKLHQVVTCINDNKYWKSCYVILKTMFPCLRGICLADINLSGMEMVYCYSIIIHIYIQNTFYDIEENNIYQYQINIPIYGIYQKMMIQRKNMFILMTQI